MQAIPLAETKDIVSGWRAGAESVGAFDNPAGPLYVGGAATEAGLTRPDVAAVTGLSPCTGSGPIDCC
ncbi:hypothetical protein AQ490_25100 [Wenjunlia vitaminophila]|uniref:Uncharacterized protein n=1 Tax=Wenjunlia vitaminophila TaxID=76728 RepID=A0A0T6LQ97_WENVI|nr:DUF6229 family protein [Wenjunlia vitaminophila]KRV48298.1 hypothetical protein AQ490_25100 [Wenjunlia vitaminophila]